MGAKYYKDLPDGKYIDKDGDILTIKNGKFNWSCWSSDNWYEIEVNHSSDDDDDLRPFGIKPYYNMFL
jgi:hypothetical protein